MARTTFRKKTDDPHGIEAAERAAYDAMKAFEKEFPKEGCKYSFQHPDGERLEKEWRKLRNTCPECGKDDMLSRENYDMMWGDADLVCTRCNFRVRMMDFG